MPNTFRASLTLALPVGGEVLNLKAYRTVDPERVDVKRSLRSSVSGGAVKRVDIDAETGEHLTSNDVHKVVTVNEISYNCSDKDLEGLRIPNLRVVGRVELGPEHPSDFRFKGSEYALRPASAKDESLYADFSYMADTDGLLIEFVTRGRQQMGLVSADRFGRLTLREVAYRDEWVDAPTAEYEPVSDHAAYESRRAALLAIEVVDSTPASSFLAKVKAKYGDKSATPAYVGP